MATVKEMLRHMFELQLYNDEQVHAKFGTSYSLILERNGFFWALADEMGEWIHELKGNWCWWKMSQAPVNQEKALEELVDGVHFVLSFCLALNNKDIDKCCDYDERMLERGIYTPSELIIRLLEDVDLDLTFIGNEKLLNAEFAITDLLSLIDSMGYKFEDVYEAYKEKNKVNLERVAGNY